MSEEPQDPQKTRLARAIVEFQVPEAWSDEEVIAQLADYGFERAKVVKDEVAAIPKGPETDAYGNRYDGKAGGNLTKDAYGNPYDTSKVAPAAPRSTTSHDAYGNPYKK